MRNGRTALLLTVRSVVSSPVPCVGKRGLQLLPARLFIAVARQQERAADRSPRARKTADRPCCRAIPSPGNVIIPRREPIEAHADPRRIAVVMQSPSPSGCYMLIMWPARPWTASLTASPSAGGVDVTGDLVDRGVPPLHQGQHGEQIGDVRSDEMSCHCAKDVRLMTASLGSSRHETQQAERRQFMRATPCAPSITKLCCRHET